MIKTMNQTKPTTNYLKMLMRIKDYEIKCINERLKIVNEIIFMDKEPNEEINNYESELSNLISMKRLVIEDMKAIQHQLDIKLDTEKEEEAEIEKKYVI